MDFFFTLIMPFTVFACICDKTNHFPYKIWQFRMFYSNPAEIPSIQLKTPINQSNTTLLTCLAYYANHHTRIIL